MRRRDFLRVSGATLASVGLAGGLVAGAADAMAKDEHVQGGQSSRLQVWSCGGLAEGMIPANLEFEKKKKININYTGAFAAVLGKSLMANGRTDVFCGRVLDLAKNLRKAGRMVRFRPLCFTQYVIITPKGNPKGIKSLEDLTSPGIRIAMAPEASPPGGAAIGMLLKRAGMTDAVMQNVAVRGSCVQRTVSAVVTGQCDAMLCEMRLSRLELFAGKLEVVLLPFAVQPPGPLTFTAGIMEEAEDAALAEEYVSWLTSANGGQAYLERAGFIPADSERGRELVEILGVRDEN